MAAIRRTVVAHDALDHHAVVGEPIDRPAGKRDRAIRTFVGEHLSVGQPGGIVDGDVRILPAGATLVALPGAIAGDAMIDPVDPAELAAQNDAHRRDRVAQPSGNCRTAQAIATQRDDRVLRLLRQPAQAVVRT